MKSLPNNIVNWFFAPASTDLLKPLIASYDSEVAGLEKAIQIIGDVSFSKAFDTFVEASRDPRRRKGAIYTKMFNLEEGVSLLNSKYWQRTMDMTDVYDHMPQKRRDEWSAMIRERKCPKFDLATVYVAFDDLLRMRSQFIAERVDGIFKALSGEHVTNNPNGFGKRMIMANVIGSYGYTMSGHIDDLRKVIAKLLGREDIKHGSSSTKIDKQINYTGEWFDWDGGTMRVRIYKKGTVHLEINPDVAWQLNQILAFLYPQSLSHASVRKPIKKHKDFSVINNPIADEILYELSQGRVNGMTFEPSWVLKEKVINILCSVGGVRGKKERRIRNGLDKITFDVVNFNYHPHEVITRIIVTGCLPDKQTHQFYPTPDELAAHVVELAEIESYHTVLEPSAGQGGLVDHIDNKDRIQCVEYSEIHCEILRAKGYNVDHCDFLNFNRSMYDRIIMNPPFSEGRAKLHVEHALKMLVQGGKLVAIVPSGYKADAGELSEPMHRMFPDAQVSVRVLTIQTG